MITKNTCEVGVHFNKENHVLSDFDFVVIEQICNIMLVTVIASMIVC